MRFYLFIILLFVTFNNVFSAPASGVDSIVAGTQNNEIARKNIIDKVIGYFNESNSNKKISDGFDFSVIGGPHYSSDTKFGLGIVAAGLYRTNKADTITQPSNVSLYGDISSVGFYLLGIKGYHLFPHDRYRLNYKLYFYSFPSKFWGIGYRHAACDSNEISYKRLQAKVEAEFMFRLGKYLYLGPSAQFSFINGKNAKNLNLWNGEDMRTKNYGVGFTMSFDSRDYIGNPYQGIYLSLEQRFYPRFLFNRYAFSSTEFTANSYNRVWKGGVVASQIHGNLTYGNTPWGMLATLGGSNSMRGYYEGRYRDKCELDATVELRQNIWHRNGIVLWIGAGTIFSKFSDIMLKRILPNYGIGYRWEFKHRVNVRLDLGFGRNSSGFVFNINEAF